MTKTTIANDRMNRPLDSVDPQIADLLREEAKRQATGLELIPSENLVSEAVLEAMGSRSEEHTSELQSLAYLVCRLLLEKKKNELRLQHRRRVSGGRQTLPG